MSALTLSVMFFSRNCDWNGNVFFSFLVLNSRAYPVTKKKWGGSNLWFSSCTARNVSYTTGLDLPRSDIAAPRYNFMRSRSARRNVVASMGQRTKPVRPPHKTTHTKETIPRFIRTFESTPRTSPSTPLYTTSKLSSHWPIRDRKLSLRVRGVHSWLYIARRRADACSAKLSAAHPSWNA